MMSGKGPVVELKLNEVASIRAGGRSVNELTGVCVLAERLSMFCQIVNAM